LLVSIWVLCAGQGSGATDVWAQYLRTLPAEQDMSCLLNYSPDEEHLLQVPRLVVSSGGKP
jgi:hypothetical protein